MNRIFLKISRKLIPFLPRGKSKAIALALRLFGREFHDVITISDGRKLYIGPITTVNQHLFFLNTYEPYETSVISRIVKAGDYVFDVGANFGWFVTLMSRLVGSDGRVFAFELVPAIADECRENVRLNHQEHNIVIEKLGLGAEEGEVTYHYSARLGLGNLRTEGFSDGGTLTSGTGRIITLDSYVGGHKIPKIDFIKCDVDGAEVLFLKGARKTLVSYRPVMIIEASGAHGRESCREIFEELARAGYVFFSLHYRSKLKPIYEHEFGGVFKENVLCLTADTMHFLETLK